MITLEFKVGGTLQKFTKDNINVGDNILAIEHQVRQSAVYSDEKNYLNPAKVKKLNEEYIKMFTEMFGNQFSVKDLMQADVSVMNKLNDIYIEALGGKEESDEKKEE